MVSKEILSGEVTTPRAKRVLYTILVLTVLNLVLSGVRVYMTGYSGFTTGTPDATGYSVVEHGRRIHVTAGQYDLGRIQVILLVLGVVVWFIARAYLSRTGDLKREKKAT
jgi:hypothetical protein